MPPNRFESEVESFLEGSHGDRTHIKRADHHTVTPLCGTLLCRRRVGGLDGVIPPIGGGELAVCGGVVAKLQTHWVKRVQNGSFG